MRSLVLCIVFLSFTIISAQSEEKEIENTIAHFFEGFHKQDSLLIKQTILPTIVMQTIGKDSLGNAILKQEKFSSFLKSIVSIPKTLKFEERIMAYHIQVDGEMANAWTPYEFWTNDTFSHCGVNSFQLFKDDGQWKIIYIIDTRRKGDCKKE